MPRIVVLALLFACFLACAAACGGEDEPAKAPPTSDPGTQAPDPGQEATWSHEVAPADAVYYFSGPQQSRPPDGTFKAGTKVNILSDDGSYVRVESDSGIVAAVSAGSLRKLP